MVEWVLLLTLNLSGPQGQIRDVSPQMLGGFTSQQACETAASDISLRFVALAGKARGEQGIKVGGPDSHPQVWTECLQVRK